MVDQGRELYNNLMQNLLDASDVLINLTDNETKSKNIGSFIRTLKGKSITKWQLMIVNLIFVIWIS